MWFKPDSAITHHVEGVGQSCPILYQALKNVFDAVNDMKQYARDENICKLVAAGAFKLGK